MDRTQNYTVYKKWGTGRFASFSLWPAGDKGNGSVIVDVGEFDTTTNKVKSATQCFVPADELLAYLYAEVNGTLKLTHASMADPGAKHGLQWFGGGAKGARVFTVQDWNFDVKAKTVSEFSQKRRFQCGLYEAVPGADGYRPDYSKPISRDSIQITRTELAALYQNLHMFQQASILLGLSKGTIEPNRRPQKDDDASE